MYGWKQRMGESQWRMLFSVGTAILHRVRSPAAEAKYMKPISRFANGGDGCLGALVPDRSPRVPQVAQSHLQPLHFKEAISKSPIAETAGGHAQRESTVNLPPDRSDT